MSQLPFVPIAEAGPEDGADASNISFLDLPRMKVNVAKDGFVRQQCDRVWDIVRRVKSRRMELEEEWLAIQRMVVLSHDEGKKYHGRSNAYLPVYARARKTLVSALSKGVFPSDEYMDVVDRENGESEEAKAIKAVLQYEFECSAKIRAIFKPFLGQFVDFGFAVMKRWYRTDKIVKPKRRKMSNKALALGQTPKAEVSYDEGFTLSNRSVFNVVVYPEWAETKRDLQIEAERLEVPVTYCNIMKASRRWENVDEALSTGGGATDQFDWANQTSLNDVSSITGIADFRGENDTPVANVIAVEVWCRLILTKDQYDEEEDPTQPIPARVLFINGVPVVARRNNFYDQQSPLEYARDNIVAGNFYGSGAGRLTRSLQYLANDFANQTNDVGIYGLNPITLVNTNYFSGAMDSLRPGRTYRVRDVEQAIKFVKPDVEIVQYGQTLLQQTVTMAQDGSGAPPVLQGSKAATTATGSQLLSQNAQSPLQDTVEDIEAQVMVPLMYAAWSLAVQYRNKPFLRTILDGKPRPVLDSMGNPVIDPATGQPMMDTGPEKVSILPSDIDIEPEMRFLASSQAINRQARQQGLQAFTQLLAPLLPLLQQQGKTLDPTEILQRAWTDGLGNRNFSKMIVPLQLQQGPSQPGGQPPPPGQPPPIGPVGQGNVMPPQDVMDQPDEGAYAGVRDNSNMMSGPMGGGITPG